MDNEHYCYYCRQPFGTSKPEMPTRDHKWPRSRKNANLKAFNDPSNVVWAHYKCNIDKGHLTSDEYFAVLEYRKNNPNLPPGVAGVRVPMNKPPQLSFQDYAFLYEVGVTFDEEIINVQK